MEEKLVWQETNRGTPNSICYVARADWINARIWRGRRNGKVMWRWVVWGYRGLCCYGFSDTISEAMNDAELFFKSVVEHRDMHKAAGS